MILKLTFLAMLTMAGFFTGVIVLQKWILPLIDRKSVKKIIIIAIVIWFPLAGTTIGVLIGLLPFLIL